MCSDHPFPCTISAICSSCRTLIVDAPATPLPMRFRETQSQWFAKQGISWHFSAVVHKSNHPDCPVVSASEHTIHTYVVAIDSCKQDWFSISCILEEVLVCVKESHQSVCRAILRSDNAGCYHCSALLSTINSTSRRSGIEVIRYDFSDPQSGKDLCDRKIAPCKQRLLILFVFCLWCASWN